MGHRTIVLSSASSPVFCDISTYGLPKSMMYIIIQLHGPYPKSRKS